MGWGCPPLYGVRNYDAKIEKIDAKVTKLLEEKAIYEQLKKMA
jgi:hypothetical protein